MSDKKVNINIHINSIEESFIEAIKEYDKFIRKLYLLYKLDNKPINNADYNLSITNNEINSYTKMNLSFYDYMILNYKGKYNYNLEEHNTFNSIKDFMINLVNYSREKDKLDISNISDKSYKKEYKINDNLSFSIYIDTIFISIASFKLEIINNKYHYHTSLLLLPSVITSINERIKFLLSPITSYDKDYMFSLLIR